MRSPASRTWAGIIVGFVGFLGTLATGCSGNGQDLVCIEGSTGGPRPSLATPLCATEVSRTELLDRHRVSYRSSLGYDPLRAAGLELLAPAGFELPAEAMTRLSRDGFVLTKQTSSSFAYGYATLFSKHLPVYVSADSILEAVHRSYDSLLQTVESRYLAGEVGTLLQELRLRLSGPWPHFGRDSVSDLDLYLTVAASLLAGAPQPATHGADEAEIARLYQAAMSASGPAEVSLFGVSRPIDFSQFTPRGHYTDSPALKRYFRAVMWLGLVDVPLLYTEGDSPLLVSRRGFETALLMTQLLSGSYLCRFRNIELTLSSFVGFPQQLSVEPLQALFAQLGVKNGDELEGQKDDALLQALQATPYRPPLSVGDVRAASAGLGAARQPRSFALLAKRNTPDGQVMTDVTYDRVGNGRVARMMPSPLDVAFAALKNDQAAALLSDELASYPYATELACSRELLDSLGPTFFGSSLYTAWLGALRQLSPPTDLSDPRRSGLPAVASTEAWARRQLGAQLASWAELRHDTLLYTAPSESSFVTCEFPTAYVDPYPEFFTALSRFAEVGQNSLSALGRKELEHAIDYFIRLREITDMLAEIATWQRRGQPLSPTHMNFINSLVTGGSLCGGPSFPGWYTNLHYDPYTADESSPVVADVFTQRGDANGQEVGRVLHVGSGFPRYMVLTVDGCSGAQAYVGLASSYHELITEGYQRLNDPQWWSRLSSGPKPPPVPWLRDLLDM